MAELPKTADRSSMEIKDLLRKLKNGTHKDRIRRLNKFRSYCTGKPPEFYDDDIPLLFLGADTPALYYEDDAPLFSYCGLFPSAGLLSEEPTTLKRSARHAMNLLAWLLLDQTSPETGAVFCKPFLSLPVSFYHSLQLNLHLAGDDRGGAKEDACRIVVLILTQHCDDQLQPSPVLLEEVVTEPAAQQAFDVWSATRVSGEAAAVMQQNAVTRQAELDRMQRHESLMNRENLLVDLDEEEFVDGPAAAGDESDHGIAEADQQEAVKKQQAYRTAVRWADSQVAREQAAADATAARQRQTQDEAEELAVREAEKAVALAKDPLTDDPVDMVLAESRIAEQAELALTEIQEDLQKHESAGVDEMVQKTVMQKESLEQLIEKLGGLEGMEQQAKGSILPTNTKFDPLLFLTLLHRKTPYKDLLSSMTKLMSKTDNQAEQLQNLVRDNFPLFVKCAEGFETFRSTSEAEVGLGVNERIEKLEAIAESAAFQAKKSFKPLLDNTTEVRKVQSALSVLSRIAPILQVPAAMRAHMEHGRYGAAMKTYRRSLVVDDTNIKLLQTVQQQANDYLREARIQLEERLVRDDISELLSSIRDLNELLELEVPHESDGGVVKLNGVSIRIREHNPATSCLLLQAARFAESATALIETADTTCTSIFQSGNSSGNHWKYDVLDSRVGQTVKSVAAARVWLPRLMGVANAAFEDEKRRTAKIGRLRNKTVSLSPYEVIVANVAPVVVQLTSHVAFLATGSNTRTNARYVEMSFGGNAPDALRTLLRSPLPPSQCTKVGKELALLVDLLNDCTEAVEDLRPSSITSPATALKTAQTLGNSALVTIEKRRCIYAFDVCSRACSNRASGSGKLDSDALLHCLQNLSEHLSRPEECSNEVEKGCELVVRRCCEGLASYVRDRGDDSRLSAVAECADMIAERVDEVIREAAFLTDKTSVVKDVITEDIVGLESAMFDEYLESMRVYVANSVRVGWLENDNNDEEGTASFPSYLSASLLAIVRCRAQVEQALGDRVRRADNVPYQHLAMSIVADGVVEGICNEVLKRKLKLKVRQADRLANELEFLKNALKKFLGEESLVLLDSTLHMVSSKAGRGRDYQGDGPDGLAALEELERLGRVYVLCLGD